MMTRSPRSAAVRANSAIISGVRWAETILCSLGTPRLSSNSTACRIVSQSEALPMTTATSAPEFFSSAMIDFHHFPRTALLAKSFLRMKERGDAIVLIGFMGAGKSSVGRTLARMTGLLRFDTDEMVAARFGLTISEIFETHGEEKFREAETDALRELTGKGEAIIVTGGGIVLRPGNVALLRALGSIVHLWADEATLFKRISRRTTRPLLRTENPR